MNGVDQLSLAVLVVNPIGCYERCGLIQFVPVGLNMAMN